MANAALCITNTAEKAQTLVMQQQEVKRVVTHLISLITSTAKTWH